MRVINGGEVKNLENEPPTIESIVYEWDTESQTYIQVFESEETSEISTPTPPRSVYPAFRNHDPFRLFDQAEYERFIEYRDEALELGADATDDKLLQWRYFTALALESLNRPDEALNEYIAVYEIAPNSAWGMLAGLHLEMLD